MRMFFADTSYWIAWSNPRDQLHRAAREAVRLLGDAKLVTTDMVLTEFLTGLSRDLKGKIGKTSEERKQQLRERRKELTRIVRKIIEEPDIIVIEQTREMFLEALNLYENRLETGYSLTDCSSMIVMRKLSITNILTSDYHFAQEGFTILIHRSA